ncbi:Short hypocotyl in white light1 protein [Quillaja saponaria]|uniref:Short hypocotyl in white light1 protein n=1 Tax=Quillaja saponaria TaxID=32244 RepID=A0AAD7LAE1_QUISA|nr:Short hypocotyl in white light1 protein [Quillaja saponaria]
MAAATATLSPFINLTLNPSSKLLNPIAKTSFPCKSLHSHYFNFRPINPRNSVCHGKLNNSTNGEPDDIDEGFFDEEDVMEDDEDEDDAESSVDLLIRFLQSMFKKVSKRAKKASRSVLPSVISPQLVSFAVDGILLLASLSVVKALLEVICTLGGTVYAVILLLRVIWTAISYFQSSGGSYNQGGNSFGAVG